MAEPLDRDMPLALAPPSHAESASLAMVEAAETVATRDKREIKPKVFMLVKLWSLVVVAFLK